jgi:AraC-like DNA-binding protein
MPAGVLHAIDCIGDVAMRTVYLGGSHPSFPDRCAVWRLSPFMRELILRLAAGPDPALAPHLLSLLVCEIETIESMPLHIPEPSDERLRRVTAELLAGDGLDMSLADLAVVAGMSPRTLIRRFQSDTGMALRQWRRQARLLRALERLAAGQSVSAAAYEAGYGSASAFVHAFGNVFGTTPGRYVRQPAISRSRSAQP